MSFYPLEKVKEYRGSFNGFPKKTPTNGEPDGPIFGNGDIGVAVGGKDGEINFYIGKNDLWYAESCHTLNGGVGGMKCFGSLKIISDIISDESFTAEQIISSADVNIRIKTNDKELLISSYAPYNEDLIVLKLSAIKGDIPLKVELTPLSDFGAECKTSQSGDIFCAEKNYCGGFSHWDTKSAAFCRIDNLNGDILHEGDVALVTVTVRTNHDGDDYFEKAKSEAEKLNADTLKKYRESHIEWWNGFWSGSGIEIPSEKEVEKFWYASHYIMACCSKKGKFAPGIFGNWVTTNTPNWAGDYHANYNYEAPWWGVYSSNKIELAEPYDQPLLDYIPQARENARDRLNCKGIYNKVGIGPKGLETTRMFYKDGTEAKDAPYWGQKSNASYAAVNMVMRFYSTWDREYAKNCALPYLKEVADFWEDYLKFEDGRYVIYNDCIHENEASAKGAVDWVDDDAHDYSDDFNPILSLGLVRMVFKAILDISEYLGEYNDKREKWEHILSHISDFPTQTRNGKTVFRYTERGMDWCDGNSLGIQHVFPCGAIGLSSDRELLKIARDTVEVMGRWSDYNAFPTFFTAAARVGYDSEIILTKFKEQFLNHSFDNLFIYYGGGGIECCSAVPSCINEMLFQSHENILHFFPVWDKSKDASFCNLRGYGAFVVSASLSGGEVKDVTIESEKGRDCSVLCPWESGMKVLENGREIACRINDGVYSFKTKAGAVYTLNRA